MSSEPALAVLAARIRMALMRHTHQAVDAANMVADTGYAQEVIALCRASHESGLSDLADQFEKLLRTAGRALPAGPPTSRFDTNRAVAEAQTARVAAPPVAPSSTTAPTAAPAPDPKGPSGGRYIRGAR